MGTPTILVPQLRRENITLTDIQASWIPASIQYSGTPWVFLLPLIINIFGRKKGHFFVSFCTFIANLFLCLSQNITHIYISEMFHGPVASAYLTTSIVLLTEYSSPKYRGIFLTFKSASFFWGILLANLIGTFCHWKTITYVGLACSSYNLLTITLWPESSYWLASKGRFQESAQSHRWVKGTDKDSEVELEALLKFYKYEGVSNLRFNSQKFTQLIKDKYFWKPILISCLLATAYFFSGKLFCAVFAVDILKKITKDDTATYRSMLILDGVTVTSMYIGCFVSKMMKRRIMFFTFTIAGITFLFTTSMYLVLVKYQYLSDNNYVTLTLLTGYSMAIGSGPVILSSSIAGELLPIESKTLSMSLIAFLFMLVGGSLYATAPFIFQYLKVYGTFLMFSLLSIGNLILLYKFLPETKDKTLQEIYDVLRNKKVAIKHDEESELVN